MQMLLQGVQWKQNFLISFETNLLSPTYIYISIDRQIYFAYIHKNAHTHKRTHTRVRIYVCVICIYMFVSTGVFNFKCFQKYIFNTFIIFQLIIVTIQQHFSKWAFNILEPYTKHRDSRTNSQITRIYHLIIALKACTDPTTFFLNTDNLFTVCHKSSNVLPQVWNSKLSFSQTVRQPRLQVAVCMLFTYSWRERGNSA